VRSLGDDARAPPFIQTVPRWGYRFLVEDRQSCLSRQAGLPLLHRVAIAVLVVLPAGSFAIPRRQTVLVLPFDDLGGANRVEAVATHEVTHALARSRVGVIDPLTASKFKNTNECIIELGKQLDAQYVLLGAVRRAGAKVRVTAELYRVADNRQAWAGEEELAAGADATPAFAKMAREVADLIENS
jgi:TolB-like protein